MTNVKPATDEQVADILGDLHQYHDYKMAECPFCAPIRARIDADREENAQLKDALGRLNEIQGGDDLLARVHDIARTALGPIFAESSKVASLSAALERWQSLWKGENALALRQAEEIAALKAEVERMRCCKRCNGTGRWKIDVAAAKASGMCTHCDGTGRAR